jgi:molybdopterin-containing oxidoreductase family iron-sulfur binding subunit
MVALHRSRRKGVGADVNPWLKTDADGLIQYYASGVEVSGKKGEEDYFSCVQYHHTMGVTGETKNARNINADEAATVYMTYGLVRQGYQGSLTSRTIIRKSHLDHLEEFIKDLQRERQSSTGVNKEQVYPGHDATMQGAITGECM